MNISVTLIRESYEKFKAKVARFALTLKTDRNDVMIGNISISLHELATEAIK